MPQRAVDGEGVCRDLGLESLREHDLIHIACSDVLLGGTDVGLELLPCLVRVEVERGRGVRLGQREIPFELTLQKLNLRAGELIQRLEIIVRRNSRVGDDENPMLHVIKGENGVEQHEARSVGAVR